MNSPEFFIPRGYPIPEMDTIPFYVSWIKKTRHLGKMPI